MVSRIRVVGGRTPSEGECSLCPEHHGVVDEGAVGQLKAGTARGLGVVESFGQFPRAGQSSSVGVKTSLMIPTWLGWIAERPKKPNCFPAIVVSRSPS